jgi:hypothetical protein
MDLKILMPAEAKNCKADAELVNTIVTIAWFFKSK